MNYIVVGLNHKTAPIHIREKVALTAQESEKTLSHMLTVPVIEEATVISTCNRVELYAVTQKPDEAKNIFFNIFEKLSHLTISDLQQHLYCKLDRAAVNHLFSVVSSIDSMVTGENQITGQVKEAYKLAHEKEATGVYLNKLFNRAFYVAKRVKSETELSQGNVSVGSVAVMLAEKIFGTLKDKSVLLLGAGEIGELVVRRLNRQKVSQTLIVNRTFEKAKLLEDQALGVAYPFEDLMTLLHEVDVLITSISGTIPCFAAEELKKLMSERKNEPLFMIDLGVPRNIAEDVSQIDNLYLYNIDDLRDISLEGKKRRTSSLDDAKSIVDDEVEAFYEQFLRHETLPTIASLGQKFELIRQRELDRALARMSSVTEKDKITVNKLTQAIVNRILHDPILSLKNKKEMSEPSVIALIHKIFRLSDEDEG